MWTRTYTAACKINDLRRTAYVLMQLYSTGVCSTTTTQGTQSLTWVHTTPMSTCTLPERGALNGRSYRHSTRAPRHGLLFSLMNLLPMDHLGSVTRIEAFHCHRTDTNTIVLRLWFHFGLTSRSAWSLGMPRSMLEAYLRQFCVEPLFVYFQDRAVIASSEPYASSKLYWLEQTVRRRAQECEVWQTESWRCHRFFVVRSAPELARCSLSILVESY